MGDTLISFKVAKLAKEKEFNFKVLKQYSPDFEGVIDTDHSANCVIGGECALKYPDKDCFGAPTQSLLQKWLREVHNIDVEASLVERLNTRNYLIRVYKNNVPVVLTTFHYYKTYEEALEIGLQEALKLIKDGSKNI